MPMLEATRRAVPKTMTDFFEAKTVVDLFISTTRTATDVSLGSSSEVFASQKKDIVSSSKLDKLQERRVQIAGEINQVLESDCAAGLTYDGSHLRCNIDGLKR